MHNLAYIQPERASRPDVSCPHCRFTLFDGLVVKTRIVRVLPYGAEAKCRCNRWVKVPVGPERVPCAAVRCLDCRFKLFDGLVVRTRVLRALPYGAEAKCRCNRWVKVPFGYLPC